MFLECWPCAIGIGTTPSSLSRKPSGGRSVTLQPSITLRCSNSLRLTRSATRLPFVRPDGGCSALREEVQWPRLHSRLYVASAPGGHCNLQAM